MPPPCELLRCSVQLYDFAPAMNHRALCPFGHMGSTCSAEPCSVHVSCLVASRRREMAPLSYKAWLWWRVRSQRLQPETVTNGVATTVGVKMRFVSCEVELSFMPVRKTDSLVPLKSESSTSAGRRRKIITEDGHVHMLKQKALLGAYMLKDAMRATTTVVFYAFLPSIRRE